MKKFRETNNLIYTYRLNDNFDLMIAKPLQGWPYGKIRPFLCCYRFDSVEITRGEAARLIRKRKKKAKDTSQINGVLTVPLQTN